MNFDRSTWKKTTIGESFIFTSKPRNQNPLETIEFIPMEAISAENEKIVRNQIKKINKVTSGTYIENGDLLVAKITPSFENGKQGFAELSEDYGYATTEVIPIKGTEGISDNRFLAYWLRQKDIRATLAGKMEGTTGRQRLSKTVLERTEIALPPLVEQKQIIETLDTIQKAINLQRSLKNQLSDLKKSMMRHLFTHGTKGENTKLTEVGEIPESWNIVSLSQLISSLDAGTSVNSNDRHISRGEKGILKTSCVSLGVFNIKENKTVIESELDRVTTPLKDDSIIISRMNTPELVGACAYVEQGNQNIFLPDRLWQVEIYDREKVYMRWLSYQLQQLWKEGKFAEIAAGTSASMKNITKSRLLALKIAMPDYEEQLSIANSIKQIEICITHYNQKILILNSLFKSLLIKLMHI